MIDKSYSTTKRKIGKLWEFSQSNSYDIITSRDTESRIITKIKLVNPSGHILNNLRNFDIDWENMVGSTSGGVPVVNQSWSIEFNQINTKFLSLIDSEIIYRLGDSGGDLGDFYSPDPSNFLANKVWDINDLENDPTSDVKQATLQISTWIKKTNDVDVLPSFQAKLLVRFLNTEEMN